jgi:hypothetical protein
VDVVRHEAVRNYFKALASATAQEFTHDLIDEFAGSEDAAATMRAEREKGPMSADVALPIKPCTRAAHGVRKCNRGARQEGRGMFRRT